MASLRWMLVLFAVPIAASARAGGRGAIAGQAPTVPLLTAVRTNDKGNLGQLVRFEGFDRERVLPQRDRLEPLASDGDPLAQLWLARLYDPNGLRAALGDKTVLAAVEQVGVSALSSARMVR